MWNNGWPPVYCPCGCDEPIIVRTNLVDRKRPPVCRSCERRFEMRDGILVLEDAPREVDFPPESFEAHDRTERVHFWNRSKNIIVKSMLDRLPRNDPALSLLDVGCGTGAVSRWLATVGYTTVGMDMWLQGLRFTARQSAMPLVCCRAESMPFRDAFDVVGIFDVIEHVVDDVALLQAALRAAKPDGHLLITVPADPRLWSPYDEIFGHKRRYTRPGLIHTIENAGLQVVCVNYFNSLLWPVQYFYRQWQRNRRTRAMSRAEATRDMLRIPSFPLNTLMRWVMSSEAIWVSRFPGFVGGSLIALARRTDPKHARVTPPPRPGEPA